MRTQQIQPRPVGAAIAKARSDAVKIAERRTDYLEFYKVLRKDFEKGVSIVVGFEEVAQEGRDLVERLDAYFQVEVLSKTGLIILDNILNQFRYGDFWVEMSKQSRERQDSLLMAARSAYQGREMFEFLEELIEKRDHGKFTKHEMWNVVGDISLLLKHLSGEAELYEIWSKLYTKYYQTGPMKRETFAQEWKYILLALKTIQKEVLSSAKSGSLEIYDGLRKWLKGRMESLMDKLGHPTENTIILSSDEDSSSSDHELQRIEFTITEMQISLKQELVMVKERSEKMAKLKPERGKKMIIDLTEQEKDDSEIMEKLSQEIVSLEKLEEEVKKKKKSKS